MSNPVLPYTPNLNQRTQIVYGFGPTSQQPVYWYGPQQGASPSQIQAQQQAYAAAVQQAAAAHAAQIAQQQALARQQAVEQTSPPQVNLSPFQPGGAYQYGPRMFSWPGWAIPPRRDK